MKATIAVLGFLGGYVVVSASAMDQSIGTRQAYDDRPFLCAAVFGALMEGRLGIVEEASRDRFTSSFDALYALGKGNLARIGGTDDDAQDVLQKYVELTADFAVKKKDEVGDLILYCERIAKAAMKMLLPR